MNNQPIDNPTVKAWVTKGTDHYSHEYLNLERAPHKRLKYRWGYSGHGKGVSFHLTPWGAYFAWRKFMKRQGSPCHD